MDLLHVPTLLLMTGVVSFVPAVAIAVQPTTGTARAAQGPWAAAYGLLGVSWLVLGLRGPVPPGVSIYAGNALLIAGLAVAILGFDRLNARAARWWLPVAGVAALVAGFAALQAAGWFTVNARLVVASAVAIALDLEIVRLARRACTGVYRRPLQVYLALMAVVIGLSLTRMVDAALSGRVAALMTMEGFHALSFFAFTITTLGTGIALLSLMNLALRAALEREVATRDEIMSLIGHDLRVPFNTLLSGADVVRIYLDQGRTGEAVSYLAHMQTAAASAYEMLENLLAWGHAQAKAGGGSRETRPVRELIEGALGPNRAAMAEKDVAAEVDDGGLTLTAEPHAVQAVLRNLVSNAVQHADPETTVRVTAEPLGDGVEIAVRDEGPGLPAELLETLNGNRPVGEVREAIKRTSGGLGLYLAAKIAATADGRLIARTPEQGRGAVLAARFGG